MTVARMVGEFAFGLMIGPLFIAILLEAIAPRFTKKVRRYAERRRDAQ